MEDPNYTMFGMADGGQDPQAILTYKDAIVLPELTVTPRGNYVHNSYDNLNLRFNKRGGAEKVNRFDDGGDTGERLISTGNEWADVGMSFVPFVGSTMDIEEAIRDPSFGNIAWATISTLSDYIGGSLIKGALKGAKTAHKAQKALKAEEEAVKAYNRAVHNYTVNGGERLSRTVGKRWRDMKAAQGARRAVAPTRRGRGVYNRQPHTYIDMPSDNTRIINPVTVYGTDALLNGIQQAQ